MTQNKRPKREKKHTLRQDRTLRLGLVRKVMPLISATLIMLTLLSAATSMYVMQDMARTSLTHAAREAQVRVSEAVDAVTSITSAMAECYAYSSDKESFSSIADAVAKDNQYILAVNVLDYNGKSLFTGEDLSKQEAYLKVRSNNKCFISDVAYDDRIGSHMFYVALPIIGGDKFIGVVETKVDAKLLKDYTADIIDGNTGSVFIVDGQGTCIAAENEMLMFNRINVETLPSYDLDFTSMTKLLNKMGADESGFTIYSRPSGSYYAAYTSIPGVLSWRLAATQNLMDFSGNVYTGFFIILGISIAAWFIIITRLGALGNRLSDSIKQSTERVKLISAGDFEHIEMESSDSDEISELLKAEYDLSEKLQRLIIETVKALDHMTSNDAKADLGDGFEGEYSRIKQALDKNIEAINLIIARISRAAEEVARGSAQMAAGAVGLSIGASQQASAVSQLFTNVADMARGVENISKTDVSFAANENLYSMLADPASERSKMELLISAMSNIAQTSEEIRKIATMIEGIVSETGILAFNASVEAARAGSAGRGFSVIASEVRQLADRSKESLESIKAQMNRIFEAIAVGKEMVDETVSAVDNMRQNVEQVRESLSQISNVIDNTAATSQETAAACEELSAQSALLRDLVSQFDYKGN